MTYSRRTNTGREERAPHPLGHGSLRTLRLVIETLEERQLLSGTRLGSETRVPTADQAGLFAQTLSPLASPTVAVHDDASFAIAYTNHDASPLGDRVSLRRFDSDRTAALANDLVLVDEAGVGDQDNAVVAALPEAGVVVAWYDRGCATHSDLACTAPFDDLDAIYARRFDGNGDPLDEEPWQVNAETAGAQSQAAVAADSAGQLTFAWTGADEDGLGGVWLRHFDANGEPIEDAEVRVFSGQGVTESPTAAVDDEGNLAVAWSVRDPFDDTSELKGLYFPAGSDTPQALTFAAEDALNPRWPSLAMSDSGDFVVAFTEDVFVSEVGTSSDVFARRFSAGGEAIDDAPFRVNSTLAGDQAVGRVAVAANGDFVVTWSGRGDQFGQEDDSGVFVQSYDFAGTQLGSETRVNTTLLGNQVSPSIGISPIGDAVITWAGFGNHDNPGTDLGDQSDDEGVFFQQFDFINPKGEIDVRGEGISILDGDGEPSETDGTVLGNAVVHEGRLTQTFVIHNIGNGRLWFLDDPAIYVQGGEEGEFSIEYVRSANIAPQDSLAFTLSFSPASTGLRKATIVIVTDDGDETPFSFDVQGIGLEAARPWQNPNNPYDVNGDGVVTGLDVLILINYLNKNGPHTLEPPTDGSSPPPYLDVNGDNRITPLDALQTINLLNSRRPPLVDPQQSGPVQGSFVAFPPSGAFPDKTRRTERSTDAVFSGWTDSILNRLIGRKDVRRWLA
jgi:hypothetical protein